MDYLVNLNLNKNELQNAVIQPLAAAPASGVLGQIYYNSADHLMYQHNGTAWVAVGSLQDVQNASGTSFVSNGIATIPNASTSAAGLMTTTQVTKLNGIATGAQVNVIETVKVNGTALTPSSKAVDITAIPLSIVTGADDLKAIEALAGTSGLLKKTAANTWTLDTTTYLSSQWEAHLITGSANSDTSTKAGGTNSVYLNLVENNTVRNAHQIVGSGTVTVASDANGKITITGATPTIPSAGTTATAISTTASGGSATTWSKSDHVHNIEVSSGGTAGTITIAGTDVAVSGLLSAAFMGVTTKISSGTVPEPGQNEALPTAQAVKTYVDNSIDALPEPMVFKGSLGTGGTITWANLPTAAANEGHTYKVITAHTAETGKPAAEVGDTIVSNGSAWIVIPSGDEPSGTVTSVGIINGGLISVSGSPITSSGSITLTHGVSTGATTKTSGFYKFSTDAYGHVNGTTAVAKSDITGLLGNYVTGIKLGTSTTALTGEVTVPIVSQTAAGLMSAADKTTLDNLSAASTGAITHTTLTIAQGQTSVSASGVASKLITFQAYQGGEAVIVDYDGTNFSIASAAASAVTIKCVVTV